MPATNKQYICYITFGVVTNRISDLAKADERDRNEQVRPDPYYRMEKEIDRFGRLNFAMPIFQVGGTTLSQNHLVKDGYGNTRRPMLTISPEVLRTYSRTMVGAPITEDHPKRNGEGKLQLYGPNIDPSLEMGIVRAVAFDGSYMYGRLEINDREYAEKLMEAEHISASVGFTFNAKEDMGGSMKSNGVPTDVDLTEMLFDHLAVWEQTDTSGVPGIPTARFSGEQGISFKESNDLTWQFEPQQVQKGEENNASRE